MQVSDKNRNVRGAVVLAVLCLVLQLALAPNVGLGNGRANFALIFASCVALQVGGSSGVVAGFAAGLLFDLSSTGPIGLMAFCLSVSSYLLGMEQRNRMAGDLGATMALFCASALGVSVVYHLAMLLVGQTSSIVDALFLRALPTALLTAVFFVPFAYYFSRVRAASGGLGAGSIRAGRLGGSRGASHLGKRGL